MAAPIFATFARNKKAGTHGLGARPYLAVPGRWARKISKAIEAR